MSEFERIARYFAPLAFGQAAAGGLLDDAAVLPALPAGEHWVISKDAMAEGIHFLPSLPPDRLARRLLRTNLSDLAAMGAVPKACFLGLSLPRATPEDWLATFAQGLGEDLAHYGLALWGGDSTASLSGIHLSLTILGTARQPVSRRGAKPGDRLAVTGSIGDAGAGLRLAKGETLPLSLAECQWLQDRYELPEPRLAFAVQAAPYVHAMMDLSDGLVADLAKLCRASGMGASVRLEQPPLSAPLTALIAAGCGTRQDALTAGDDYELLLAYPPERQAELQALAGACHLPLTPIGEVTAATTVQWLDAENQPVRWLREGFDHFAAE